jgi:hypothetical protein
MLPQPQEDLAGEVLDDGFSIRGGLSTEGLIHYFFPVLSL